MRGSRLADLDCEARVRPIFSSMRFPNILLVLMLASCAARLPAPLTVSCLPHGSWVAPATGRVIGDPVAGLAARDVILLGEHHDSAADHAWQLATIEALYARTPGLVLGFEMFPRGSQPALDHWSRGESSEAVFLEQSRWAQVWGMDPGLYMPIFRFARDHRIPMLALNVSGRLVHLVGKAGWSGVAVTDREGVGTPAPPLAGYRASLADAMAGHAGPAMTPDHLARFIDAQLLWDRAMAEGIAAQRLRQPARPVVAIMGAGHLEHGYGVPYQLRALGVTSVAVLLQQDDPCAGVEPGVADAVHIEEKK